MLQQNPPYVDSPFIATAAAAFSTPEQLPDNMECTVKLCISVQAQPCFLIGGSTAPLPPPEPLPGISGGPWLSQRVNIEVLQEL
jgi:hypothetical protein